MSKDERQEEKETNFFPIKLGPFSFRLPFKWRHYKWEIEEKKILEYNPHDIEPGHGKIIVLSRWFGLSKSAWAILNVDGKRLEQHELR